MNIETAYLRFQALVAHGTPRDKALTRAAHGVFGHSTDEAVDTILRRDANETPESRRLMLLNPLLRY